MTLISSQRPEQNETSLAIVSRQHPLLPLPQLEAEGAGLLDRLLSVFQDPNMYVHVPEKNAGKTDDTRDPILVDATLNCLAVLIRTRPPIANKILAAVLNFNPLRSAPTAMTPRLHVIYRSMERTTFALLKFVLKSMPNHSMAEKIHAYMMRLQQQRTQMFSGAAGVKRPAEPTDGLDDAKRQRLTGPEKFPPMPHPPNTVAQLFTLTEDTMLHQFDVKLLPADIVSSVVFLLMQMLEQGKMDPAIAEVRARYEKLKKASLPTAIPDIPLAGPTGIDDEDDYEPDFALPPEGTVANTTEKALEELAAPALDLGPFELPKPPPLTGTEVATLSDQSIRHVLNQIVGLESAAATTTRQKLGLNRLAAAANDRDAWVTIICRLAARTSSSIDEYQALSDSSQSDSTAVVKTDPTNSSTALANRIREHLFMYILDDFRPRLSIAISWLSEEWYADKLHARSRPNDIHAQALPNYATWSIRLLDRLVQYLDARDKNLLIRFLSEIPSVTPDIMALVKTLARDPERVGMCILAMQYLLMFRPPSRNVVMRVLREVWEEGDAQVKGVAGKALKRFEHLEGGGGQAVEGGDVRVDEKSAVKRDGEGQVAKNEEEVAKNEADEVRVQNEADV